MVTLFHTLLHFVTLFCTVFHLSAALAASTSIQGVSKSHLLSICSQYTHIAQAIAAGPVCVSCFTLDGFGYYKCYHNDHHSEHDSTFQGVVVFVHTVYILNLSVYGLQHSVKNYAYTNLNSSLAARMLLHQCPYYTYNQSHGKTCYTCYNQSYHIPELIQDYMCKP